MIVVAVLAGGAADPEKGPGGTWGLLVAAVICYLIWRVDKWRQQRKGGGVEGAPPPVDVPRPRHAAAGELAAPEPLADVEPEILPWYGRIVRGADGIYRRARHIAATGESPRAVSADTDSDPGPEPAGAAVEPYRPPAPPLADVPVPVDPDSASAERFVRLEPAGNRRESPEAYAARCLSKGFGKAAVVAGLNEHFGMPRATAYRLLGRLAGRSRAA